MKWYILHWYYISDSGMRRTWKLCKTKKEVRSYLEEIGDYSDEAIIIRNPYILRCFSKELEGED